MIRVRIRNPEAIRAKLRPQQGVKVDNEKLYLYDPDLILDAQEDARDWAIKTDGLVDEEDYSSKAWAIGGTGTETNNSKYWAGQSATSATSASNSATSASSSALNAGNSATIATTQAGIATTQAGIATTKAGEASSSASTATTQAGIATTKAGEAATSATNASNSATSAYNSATAAAGSAVNAGNSANIAGTHATNAQTWAEGTDAQVALLGGEKSSKGWAQRAKDLVDSIGTVLHYKGSVATYADLPTTGQEIGDVYNVLADGSNYAWDGSDWDDLSGIVDLSAYRTAADQDLIDIKKLENTATGSNSLSILGSVIAAGSATAIGVGSTAGANGTSLGRSADSGNGGLALGALSKASGSWATAIGNGNMNTNTATATGSSAIALGHNAHATANNAIQIGEGTNSTADSLKVGTYSLLDLTTGYIPNARINPSVMSDTQKVIDIVSTYADLQSYDTSTVSPNSIIKVIADENNSGKTSWYKWESQGGGTAFVQPTLSADGTIGGASFAVACDSTYNRGGNPDYAWHAFDGRTNVSTTYPSSFWNSNSGQPHWIEFYNPTPLEVTNIKIYNGESGSVAKDWQFQCSDNGSTWTTLTSGTNTTTGQGADWSFNVPSSGSHKYYRFYTTSAQGSFSAHTTITEIVITATEGGSYSWVKINEEGKYLTGITSGDVTTALGYTPANDSNVVKTSGNQSIDDIKTFTGHQKLRGNTLKRVNVARGSTPTSNQMASIYMTDSTENNGDNNTFGLIRTQVDTSGNVQSFISAFKNITAGTNYNINLVAEYNASEYKIRLGGNQLGTDTNGSLSTVTNSTANNTIPTMGWVNNPSTSTNVVHRTGNETIAGDKTFSNIITGSAGKGYKISGTNHYYVLRSSGSPYEGCALLLDNDATKVAFNAGSSSITIGSANITPLSVTPATSDNSSKIATTAFVKNQGYLTATESKSGDGYVKFSNGIIIQWGTISSNTTSATLPTPFTTTDYRVVLVASPSNGSATYNAVLDGGSLTTTGFEIGVSSTVSAKWIAIGW